MSNTRKQQKALHPRKVKEALYNDQVVEHRGWIIRINANDMIEVFPPDKSNADAFEAPLSHLDRVVSGYCKQADMPIPGVNQTQGDQVSVPAPKKLLGPNSDEGEGWKSPTVNKRPKGTDPKGTSAPSTSMGKDTSGNDVSNFTPRVVRPKPNVERGGLPDTSLGPDSQGNATNWRDKDVRIKDDGRMARRPVRRRADEFDVKVQQEPGKHLNKGETPSDPKEFVKNEEEINKESEGKEARFVDNFEAPRVDATDVYRRLRANRPSESLLRDVMDPHKWAANNVFMPKKAEYKIIVDGKPIQLADPTDEPYALMQWSEAQRDYDEGAINSAYILEDGDVLDSLGEDADVDDYDVPSDTDFMNWEASKKKSKVRRQAGPRLRENWGGDGAYSRDLEAESPEHLHALTLALAGEDIDFSQFAPTLPDEIPEGDQVDAGGAAPGGGQPVVKPVASKRALEDPSKATKKKKNPPTGLGEEVGGAAMGSGFGASANCGGSHDREDKEAVDPAAKGYWSGYFGEYGKQLTRDEADPPESKSPKKKKSPADGDKGKDARRAAWLRARAAKSAQAAPPAPGGAPTSLPGGANAAPVTGAPPAPGGAPAAPKAPGAPGAPPAPGGAPAAPGGASPAGGSGDQGLQALGWTAEEINVMDPEDKQKILQYKIKRPGTKVGPTTPSDAAPKAPAAPGAPPAPGGAPAAPVSPAPAARVGKLLLMKVNRRMAINEKKLSQAAPTTPQSAPATAAPSPLATPVAPGASQAGPPQPGAGKAPAVPKNPSQNPNTGELPVGDPDSTESKVAEDAFQILAEVQQMQVMANSPEQVTSVKSAELAKRLLNELGVTMQEARELYGLTKNQSFGTLLK